MKKLLLTLALPLLLVGCADSGLNLEKKDFGWKEVKQSEYLEVHFSNSTNRYYTTTDLLIKYKVVAYTSVTEVFVTGTWTNGKETNVYYIGTDITVYLYEV